MEKSEGSKKKHMRRRDRELKDFNAMMEIIKHCQVIHIAMAVDNMPYVVPVNFGYSYENEKLELYFHCAKTGKKVDILKINPNICFEMDCDHQLIQGVSACAYSFQYSSIIGMGKAEFIEDTDLKKQYLNKLMLNIAQKEFDFNDQQVADLAIVKIVVSQISGKQRIAN